MFGFLIGNAQQDRQQSRPNSSKEPVQTYRENHAGYPSEIDLYRYSIRKTDNNLGFPGEIDVNRYSIRKTDINLGFPSEIDLYRYTIRKTD